MRKSISIVVLTVAALAIANVSFARGGSGGGGGRSGGGNSGGNSGWRPGGNSGGNWGGQSGWHSDGHHGGYSGGQYYVAGYGSDVIVDPNFVTTDYAAAPDPSASVSNPSPTSITLVNPASNRVALKYRLDDGDVQTLSAGYHLQINQACVIAFDRGGASGPLDTP